MTMLLIGTTKNKNQTGLEKIKPQHLPLNSFCVVDSNWCDCATVLISSWITTRS